MKRNLWKLQDLFNVFVSDMCFDGGFDLWKSRGNEYKRSPFWDYRSRVIKGEMKDELQNSQRWLLTFMWVNLFRWCTPTASHHDNNYLIVFAISTSLQKRTMQTPHGRVKTILLHNFKFFYISVIMMITHCCFCYQPQHACWFCFLLPTDQPHHWPQNHMVRACTTLFLEGYMTAAAQPW